MFRCLVALVGVLILSGCPPDMMAGNPMVDAGVRDERRPDGPDGGQPEAVRFNQIQMRGTVNSYHDYIGAGAIPEVRYRHIAIDRQAAEQGIRQFDFDLSADRRAGRYLWPVNAENDIDSLNRCSDWIGCLWELRDWSDAHPEHPMVVVLVGEALVNLDFMPHLHHQLDVLEESIIFALGRARLYTPGEMRRGFPSLRAAIDGAGWPTVDETRGRVLFVLKDRGLPRTEYIVNGGFDPDDRLLFVAGDPELADEPASADEVIFTFEPDWPWDYETDPAALPVIERLVQANLLVHVPTDNPDFAARLQGVGAQMIATRFPDMLPPVVEQPVVCNPVTRPQGCPDGALDPR